MHISETYQRIRDAVPPHVTIVLACKTRTAEEVAEVIRAGAADLGHNYVQEAEKMVDALGETALRARWHMIGPLQKNKINKALRLFDAVQTVHGAEQADAIDQRAGAMGKTLSVLIEINSAEESAKSGLPPRLEAVMPLAAHISRLSHLSLEGLMTMGPFLDDPEEIRPHFRRTRTLFDALRKEDRFRESLRTLSMGMSDSYTVAIEEGSNMIRLGTSVFGPRH